MTKIKIGETEYALRYTLESWKKLKEVADITPMNFQEKIQEDMTSAVGYLVYYGLPPDVRGQITENEIDKNLDFSSMDLVSKAIIESMPERARKVIEDQDVGKDDDQKN